MAESRNIDVALWVAIHSVQPTGQALFLLYYFLDNVKYMINMACDTVMLFDTTTSNNQ